jgi:hypothetical protein
LSDKFKSSIIEYLSSRVNAIGFAPVDRFEDAPQKHHPARVCKDAQTVIVIGETVPRGILRSPDYNLHALYD